MEPPYQITSTIFKQISAIAKKLGEAYATHLEKPSLVLRGRNRFRTIQFSLKIAGNTPFCRTVPITCHWMAR